jgi:hypothetical protein
MKKIILLSISAIFLFAGCNSSNLVDVFSELSVNNIQYGATGEIDLNNESSWLGFSSTLDSNSDIDILMNFTSPSNGQKYSGFAITNISPSIGTSTGAILSLVNGNNVLSCSNLSVTMTQIASGPGEFDEGTFTGIVTITVMSPLSSNSYPCSGSFKVIRRD